MDRDTRVCVLPGSGVVVRFGTVVAFMPEPVDAGAPLLIDWVRWAGRQTMGGRTDEFLDALTHRFTGADVPALPTSGILRLGAHPIVVVSGPVVATIERLASADEIIRGRDGPVHAEVVGPYGTVTLHLEGVGVSHARDDLDLHSGVVPGGGVVIMRAPTTQPEPGPEEEDTVQVPVPEGRASDTGELIEGIVCPEDHFNHPNALECAICGRSLLATSRQTIMGARPPLGTLVFDDGTRFTLRADCVIGREPELDSAVVDGRAMPLRLEDPEHLVSRIHADVRLVGWNVRIIDRGSANGVLVMPPDSNRWHRLARDEPYTLSPGTRIAIGRRICTYEWSG